ncbi:acyltransferase family protein [Halobacillus litoralis]|uniref:Acyltransferase family protein n=1 Tax=Halobacillus litoralis TaxID=45668 RepID=A0A845F6G0_9BACI|nr:acyltransferase family protein [Halobacillus litoralis]
MNDLRAPEKRFRPEIEGVRAIAALLVAVYHIWLGSVSGGVDVFFIVSGYLITTSLLSKMVKEGRIHIGEYLLGLGRRLFPVAFTVILVIMVGSIWIMPEAQWKQIIAEGFSSAFYFQNWQLAFSSVDYLAQNNQASPFQHFWALSIQGQFYITWPLVIMIAYYIARKLLKTPVRKTLLGVLVVMFMFSFTYSIYKTAVNQPWAYFDTFARVWEFSLGGMLALLIPYLSFKKTVSVVMGWLGLAIIVFTGIVLPVSSVFPGYVALLPTTGVILIIISAENSGGFGVDRLLGSKLLLKFGGISYGFYLWHWPLLIFYYTYFDTDTITTLAGLSIIMITCVLAYLSVRFIETPVRSLSVKTSKKRIGMALTVFMFPVLIVNLGWEVYSSQVQSKSYEVEDYPGARMISDNVQPAAGKEPFPSTIQVQEELPAFYDTRDCFTYTSEQGMKTCSRGETENPDYTIALVGGSHSGHWFPALKEISDDLNLQINIYNKDACRFSADDFDGLLNETCMEWNEEVLNDLMEEPPDVVFTTSTVNSEPYVPEGYIKQWEKLEGLTEIFAVRDNPRMEKDAPLCLDEKDDIEDCAVPRSEALSEEIPWEQTDGIPDHVTFADLSEYFCGEDLCKPVVGNVIVYRDEHHLSTIYSRTLAPAVEEHLQKVLEKVDQKS